MVAVAQEFLPRIRRNEPMSRHTSWHVGGPAEIYLHASGPLGPRVIPA